jgi:tRNA (mo5U34)-methyltransferase
MGVANTTHPLERRLRARSRRRRLQRAVESVPYWHHSIDLGDGVVTPGQKDPGYHADELQLLHLPDLEGKSVLDVGAWDGFYAFEAERRGAARVVAVDSYIWRADLRLWGPPERRAPRPSPGRRGFEIAREALGSSVEAVEMDVDELDPARLGTFDVVLLLGVLYHLRNPLQCLERVAAVTDDLLVVESHLNRYAGLEQRAICEFYETDELVGDPTNWWGPNAAALVALMRAAGCRRAELVGTFGEPDATDGAVQHYRGIAHGHR